MSIEIKQDLDNELRKSSWKRLIGSQFVKSLSLWITQLVYRCEQFSRRRLQESFLSKAVLPSSILAAAEDRAHVGLKISPSTGIATLTNNSDQRKSLPAETPLISRDLNDYIVLVAAEVPAKSSIDINIAQLKIEIVDHIIEQPSKWYSVLLSKDVTARVHKADVFVNGELWEKAFKFRNTNGTSKAYMEFYKSTQQLGFRFGNNISGRIPAKGDQITIKLYTTIGESTLIDMQPLDFTADSTLASTLEITTKTPITGGASGDSIEDIRNGSLYSTSYDHQLAWDGDYRQFIKDNIGGLVWLSVWGEEEQENLHGYNLENINSIFISYYSDRKTDAQVWEEIESLFNNREGYNEKYIHIGRMDEPFSLVVNGKVGPNGSPENAEKYILDKLAEQYGKDTTNKPYRIPVDQVWDYISEIKNDVFISEFTVTAVNLPLNSKVGHYSYLDVDASVIKFTY